MGETLNAAKDALDEAIETLRATSSETIPEKESRHLVTRLQLARNALAQNEKKIWIRTKLGKEMLADFGEASRELLGAMESGSGLEEIEAALKAVERQAKRINEESRRRSMVVT